jgi:uncharacterized protein YlxW (UPF0749 family)
MSEQRRTGAPEVDAVDRRSVSEAGSEVDAQAATAQQPTPEPKEPQPAPRPDDDEPPVEPAGSEPAGVDPEPEVGPAPPTQAVAAPLSGLPRARAALRPHMSRSQLVVGLLLAVLGFAAAVQVRSLDTDIPLNTARQSDLIRILDDVTDRSERLEAEVRELEATRNELRFGSDRAETALEEARRRAETLGILAGTLPAQGPGIHVSIRDPEQRVDAPILLDTLQELRAADAEAVQINDVRVSASTNFLDDAPGSVRIDGRRVRAPYVFKVIGDPETLAPALRIPGGVLAVLAERGAQVTVDAVPDVEIDALRVVSAPEYARPAQGSGN